MSGTEWDDEEPDYPPAPLPPHERAWRHPSELGETVPAFVTTSSPTVGRAAVTGFALVGAVLMVGLVQLLLPRSGSSVTAISTSGTRAPLAAELLTGTAATVAPVATAAVEVTESIARSSGVRRPAATNAMSTLKLVRAKRAAVPIGDGRRAITTAASLEPSQTIDIVLDDGTSLVARVAAVDQGANVAVLELTEPMAGAAPAIADRPPRDGDQVSVGCGDAAEGVLVQGPGGMTIATDGAVDEGAPVLDESGRLVGLASTDGDVVRLVPVTTDITKSPAVLGVEVWLGVTFDERSLTVTTVFPGSPAEAVGIQPGDTLLGLDDDALASQDDLRLALAEHRPNDVVLVLVQRGDVQILFNVMLGARPA